MPKTPAQEMMEHETRVRYGPVPSTLRQAPLAPMSWQFGEREFLLRGLGDNFFHYRQNEGITVERSQDGQWKEEPLFLSGSVYAAIASLNGLVPIHASAVAANGAVFAFTGPAGAGKSTLVAALGDRGLPMFCDDTLVLDLADPTCIRCLPGHKRLKLKADAFELTDAVREELVSPIVEKCFASPCSGDVGEALPLAELVFLEDGDEPAIVPLVGFERFARMQEDHYTSHLYAAAHRFDTAGQFAHLARLAGSIRMSRFVRPFDRSRFAEGAALVARNVTSGGSMPRAG